MLPSHSVSRRERLTVDGASALRSGSSYGNNQVLWESALRANAAPSTPHTCSRGSESPPDAERSRINRWRSPDIAPR